MRMAKTGSLAKHVVLIGLVIIVLVPLGWVFSMSLKTLPDAYRIPLRFLPNSPTLKHYDYVIRGYPLMKKYYINSVIVTTTSVAIVVVVCSLAGYAFGWLEFPGRDRLFWGLTLTMFFPVGITTLFGIFEITDRLNLMDTRLGLILPYSSLHLVMYTFIMRGVFLQIPKELVDAAKIDGCSYLGLFRRVMLPLASNGLIVITMLAFISIWGEFIIAKTLTYDEAVPLSMGLMLVQTSMGDTEFPVMAAAYTLAIGPPIILFVVLQKWFIRGLVEGALKF